MANLPALKSLACLAKNSFSNGKNVRNSFTCKLSSREVMPAISSLVPEAVFSCCTRSCTGLAFAASIWRCSGSLWTKKDACYMQWKVHHYNSYLEGYPLWDTSRQKWEVSVVALAAYSRRIHLQTVLIIRVRDDSKQVAYLRPFQNA